MNFPVYEIAQGVRVWPSDVTLLQVDAPVFAISCRMISGCPIILEPLNLLV